MRFDEDGDQPTVRILGGGEPYTFSPDPAHPYDKSAAAGQAIGGVFHLPLGYDIVRRAAYIDELDS